MKKYSGLLVLALLLAGGILVLVGEKSKGRVGLDAVMQVTTDAQRDVDRVGFGLTRVSDEEEMQCGKEISSQVGGWWGSGRSEMTSYVNSLGQSLAQHVRRPGIKYTFHVVDSPEVNAFALPGGQIFVLRGLIEFCGSEAELAMIVGHEIAHVDLRHCIELFQDELLVKKVAGGGFTDLLGGLRFIMVKAVGTMAGLVHRILTQGYRQFQEFDADSQGWSLATAAGYDPQAGIMVMSKLSELFSGFEGKPSTAGSPLGEIAGVVLSAPGAYMRSHPPTVERIRAFKRILESQKDQLASRTFYIGRENLRLGKTRRQQTIDREFKTY